MTPRPAWAASLLGVFFLVGSCGDDPGPAFQGVDLEAEAPQFLSEMNLMRWDGERVIYEDNVEPYEMAVPLFSDYALKDRAIFIPPGTKMSYRENQILDFPVGTVILKSFIFPEDFRQPEQNLDIIETRVLVRYEDGWEAFPYVWDPEINDAVLKVQGEGRSISFIDEEGNSQTAAYLVPQKNQCRDCHELKDLDTDVNFITPIGPKPRHLNRESHVFAGQNQLEHMVEVGMLEGLPPMDQVAQSWDMRELETTSIDQLDPETLERAAKDYLDINCAHCHNPAGVNGISSQLFLNWDNDDDFHYGFCKKPGSAGKGGVDRDYDIVPGDAEASILVYRMETLEIGAMMPLLGRSLMHAKGSALVRAWIDGLPYDDCTAAAP